MEIRKLAAAQIKTLPPGKHSDGSGLWLNVSASGTRSWTVRVSVRGRRREAGIGSFPGVSLAEARRTTAAMQAEAKRGDDPITARDRGDVPTFEHYARQVYERVRGKWVNANHDKNWLRTLELYAFPHIGHMRLDEIRRPDVIDLLDPIWTEKHETARRVHQRISRVMESAIAYEWIEYNPAGTAIAAALKQVARGVSHQRAIPYSEIPEALVKIANSRASRASKHSLAMITLTGLRSREALDARWDEIDIAAGVWTVPAERMKGRIDHRVPLVRQALMVLANARQIDDGSGLVFPSPLQRGKPLATETPLNVLKKLGIDTTVHGLRTPFRQYALEQTEASHAVAEAALSHNLGNPVEQAYIRSADLFDQRKKLMQQWADYCMPAEDSENS